MVLKNSCLVYVDIVELALIAKIWDIGTDLCLIIKDLYIQFLSLNYLIFYPFLVHGLLYKMKNN